MRKLVLATISLDNMGGGLERNILYLANHMAKKDYEVHLITFDKPGTQAFYDMDSAIIWHQIGMSAPHGAVSFGLRMKLLGKIRYILNHDAPKAPIICFHHGILIRFFLASLFLNNPLICSERNSLSIYKYIRASKYNLNYFMLFLTRAITVQFSAYKTDYNPLLRRRITPISNPVFPVSGQASVQEKSEEGRYTLLTVTRLCRQKNLEELIRAFALIAKQYPEWDLKIIGDGDWQERLQNLIEKLNLQGRVFLLGKQKNVADFYKDANLFCLPSQWEGFPNALAEALSFGLPAVGYADCAGVNILIEEGKNGFLAKENANIQTLSQSLDKLMADPSLREEMGAHATQSIQKYEPAQIFQKWESLLNEVSET